MDEHGHHSVWFEVTYNCSLSHVKVANTVQNLGLVDMVEVVAGITNLARYGPQFSAENFAKFRGPAREIPQLTAENRPNFAARQSPLPLIYD